MFNRALFRLISVLLTTNESILCKILQQINIECKNNKSAYVPKSWSCNPSEVIMKFNRVTFTDVSGK